MMARPSIRPSTMLKALSKVPQRGSLTNNDALLDKIGAEREIVGVAALESSADRFRHKNLLHAQYHRSTASSANTRLRQPASLLLFSSTIEHFFQAYGRISRGQ